MRQNPELSRTAKIPNFPNRTNQSRTEPEVRFGIREVRDFSRTE